MPSTVIAFKINLSIAFFIFLCKTFLEILNKRPPLISAHAIFENII